MNKRKSYKINPVCFTVNTGHFVPIVSLAEQCSTATPSRVRILILAQIGIYGLDNRDFSAVVPLPEFTSTNNPSSFLHYQSFILVHLHANTRKK